MGVAVAADSLVSGRGVPRGVRCAGIAAAFVAAAGSERPPPLRGRGRRRGHRGRRRRRRRRTPRVHRAPGHRRRRRGRRPPDADADADVAIAPVASAIDAQLPVALVGVSRHRLRLRHAPLRPPRGDLRPVGHGGRRRFVVTAGRRRWRRRRCVAGHRLLVECVQFEAVAILWSWD